MTIIRARGGGITLADIPANAAANVSALRRLGPSALQALDKANADGIYATLATAASLQQQIDDLPDPGGGGTTIEGAGPVHPLAYRPLSTRPAGFGNGSDTYLSDGIVRSSIRHQYELATRAIGRLGVVYANFAHGFGQNDIAGPNAVTVRSFVGAAVNGVVPRRCRGYQHVYLESGEMRDRWADGDQISFSLPPGDVVIFDSGQSFAAGAPINISTFATVAAGEKFILHSNTNDIPTKESGTLTTSTSDTAAGAAYGTWTGNTTEGFSFLTLVDLDDPEAGVGLLVIGDSLLVGASYGGGKGLRNALVPHVSMAKAGEQAQQFAQLEAKTLYRRHVEARFTYDAALGQYFTNDATLVSQSLAVWESEFDELIQFLNRRGITKVAWGTLPPNTGSVDSWATQAGQYLLMSVSQRGPNQRLMQDWNNELRSGTLLYTDPTLGWKLYAPPATRPFWTGGVAVDYWTFATVLEAVNTTVTAGAPDAGAGYDFGGLPIMKWKMVGGSPVTTDGLHDGGQNSLRASAVVAVVNHILGRVPLF